MERNKGISYGNLKGKNQFGGYRNATEMGPDSMDLGHGPDMGSWVK
jgi:hypothetical protein